MKCLRRNLTSFDYYRYTSEETDLNENGEHTGEFYPVYDDPVSYKGNLSTPSGQTNQTFYGEDIRYTHTLVLDNPYLGIEENGIIYCGGHWYDIMAVRPSLNALSIALKRRTEDNQPPEPDDGGDDEGEEPEEPIEGVTGGEAPEIPDEPVEPDMPVEPGETGETGENE